MEKPVERIDDCGEKQSDCAVPHVKDLVLEIHQALAEKILERNDQSRSCSACAIALFLMASENLMDSKTKSKEEKIKEQFLSKTNCFGSIQCAPGNSAQTENNLWTLAAMRVAKKGFLHSGSDWSLSDCIGNLEQSKSHVLGLMLWLFPEFADDERMMRVGNMIRDNYAWLTRDKMLFWISCVKRQNCSIEKVREIEEQILGLRLDTGVDTSAFATVGGRDAKGDLISSAIALLVLIFCAKRKSSRDVINAARRTVQWIVTHKTVMNVVDAEPDVAWALYALSEYIIAESTGKMDTTAER